MGEECCTEILAACFACTEGQTIEEYCQQAPYFSDCPTSTKPSPSLIFPLTIPQRQDSSLCQTDTDCFPPNFCVLSLVGSWCKPYRHLESSAHVLACDLSSKRGVSLT